MWLELCARKAFPSWNAVPFTERDALKFLRKKAFLVEGSVNVPGLYTEYKGYLFIVVDRRLRGYERLWVIFHEIGHLIFHTPSMQCFDTKYESKADYEANTFAAVAIIPFEWLQTRTDSEMVDDGIPKDLLKLRKEIFDRHGI